MYSLYVFCIFGCFFFCFLLFFFFVFLVVVSIKQANLSDPQLTSYAHNDHSESEWTKGIMAMKRQSTLLRTPELETHHQTQFSELRRGKVWWSYITDSIWEKKERQKFQIWSIQNLKTFNGYWGWSTTRHNRLLG